MNIRLHQAPKLSNELPDALQQLNYMQDKVHHDLGLQMQQLFPEGYDFTNALYGLCWTAVAMQKSNDAALYKRAMSESVFAYNCLNSETGRSVFTQNMDPPYGIFYLGWKNYLLANIIRSEKVKDTVLLATFDQNCKEIANAFSKTTFPDSYPDNAWPTDATVAMASLALHDQITTPAYSEMIKNWINIVNKKLDPSTGLIPHSVISRTGYTLESSRGSSMALMLIFMGDIDTVFANELYPVFKNTFLTTRLGLPVLREYPQGLNGSGDVDSGPVLFGVGFSGTIVAPGACMKMGDIETAEKISAVNEACGFPSAHHDEKKYLYGKLPMADLFILWGRLQKPVSNTTDHYSPGNFVFIHVLTLLLIALWVWRVVFVIKITRRKY